jgi:hypothetical protein
MFIACSLYQKRCVEAGRLEAMLVEANTVPMRVAVKKDITECQLCQREFGIFSSKHHCRAWYVSAFLLFTFILIVVSVFSFA